MRVCETKIFYDTEFAAQRAASIAEHRWREEMIHYPCGRHWHIAHKKKLERNQHPRREKKDWCSTCQQVIRPNRYWKHILTGSHLRKEKEQA